MCEYVGGMTILGIPVISTWFELVAIIAAIWAVMTWRHGVLSQRSSTLMDLLEKFHNPEISEFFYRYIDGGIGDAKPESLDWFDAESFYDIEIQKEIDTTFSFFSYLAYLDRMKMLRDPEFEFFKYQMRRLLQNLQSQKYLFSLVQIEHSNGLKNPFSELLFCGKRLGVEAMIYCHYSESGYSASDYEKLAHSLARRVLHATHESLLKKENERAGEYARRVFTALQDAIDQDHVDKLCDLQYSKEHFKISYPVLMNLQNAGGRFHLRYYVAVLRIAGEEYRLCSQWVGGQQALIEEWVRKKYPDRMRTPSNVKKSM